MKQKPIHSQTTPILFQHPTMTDLRPSVWKVIYINLKEFSLFALLAFLLWLFIQLCYLVIGG
ncbi:hypothetical protein [Acinetobacter venetianus]|uniref:hypothetical protein n=1 Tax=Acinetobacter venetianus TaxID=52133 RepID=UPI0009BD45EC|nr:hypothetical protein [Acinetobacter venetianus]